SPGDRFRVSVESHVVRYWKNGVLLYTSMTPPAYALRAGASLYNLGATVSSAALGGTLAFDTPTWVAPVGVTTTGNQIVKNGAAGWNAGVASGQVISASERYVEFTAAETNTSRICGLGQRQSAVSYDDVEFGILLTSVHSIAIYESGSYIGGFGEYAAGDLFR